MNRWKTTFASLWKQEDGIGTLEMMLIIAVIIIIAVAFRRWIMKWVHDLFTSTDSEVSKTNMSGNSDSIGPSQTP